MSYILDALKKSESERQNQDLPNINAVHQRPELHPQKKTAHLASGDSSGINT